MCGDGDDGDMHGHKSGKVWGLPGQQVYPFQLQLLAYDLVTLCTYVAFYSFKKTLAYIILSGILISFLREFFMSVSI